MKYHHKLVYFKANNNNLYTIVMLLMIDYSNYKKHN